MVALVKLPYIAIISHSSLYDKGYMNRMGLKIVLTDIHLGKRIPGL